MSDVGRNRISDYVDAYNDNICKEAQKKEEIQVLKSKIQNLEIECSELKKQRKQHAVKTQTEVYRVYREKDLVKMVSKVEKITNKEMAQDFRGLVDKFCKHEMQINDIAQLDTFCKLCGSYVQKENGIIKGIFKALGGTLDD